MKRVKTLTLFTLAFAGTAGAARCDRLYVFGDSYSDTGAGYVDGNGPTAVAYLAERLGLKLLASIVENPGDAASLNFAVSGAGTGSSPGKRVKDALLGFGMRNQVDEFSKRVRSHSITFQAATTLFYLAGGLNDKQLSGKNTVDNLETEIKVLYELGGRHFALAVLPTAIPAFSDVGRRLNPELAKIPPHLLPQLPGASLTLSDWGSYFDEVIENPARYGIRNTRDACAGRAIFDENATPCAHPEAYFYYHSGHPSTAVHRAVGEKLFRELTLRDLL